LDGKLLGGGLLTLKNQQNMAKWPCLDKEHRRTNSGNKLNLPFNFWDMLGIIDKHV